MINEKIGEWTQETLIRVIKNYLDSQPPTAVQSLKVDELEVMKRLLVRQKLDVSWDTHIQFVGGTGQPAFAHSWVNYGGGAAPAGFWKDAFEIIHLQGLIKSGTTGQSAFTLPPGFRSASQHVFDVISNGALGRVDVNSDGTVTPTTLCNNTYVSLDGICFRLNS
jgi:hypothetical protein